jgi:hypothetical protein
MTAGPGGAATAPLPSARYERKFLARDASVSEVLAVVRRHPALFRQSYPPRTVNNVYLDSPGLGDYLDHVRGAPWRAKTRVRWYGAPDGQVLSPTLERKFKRGALGGKAAYALAPIRAAAETLGADVAAALAAAEVPGLLREALARTAPVLVNRYDRWYFLSADGRFRLTIDAGLAFSGLDAPSVGVEPAGVRAGGVVVELKFDPAFADEAAAITNRLPFRMGRFSKYVLGISLVGAGVVAAGSPPATYRP